MSLDRGPAPSLEKGFARESGADAGLFSSLLSVGGAGAAEPGALAGLSESIDELKSGTLVGGREVLDSTGVMPRTSWEASAVS